MTLAETAADSYRGRSHVHALQLGLNGHISSNGGLFPDGVFDIHPSRRAPAQVEEDTEARHIVRTLELGSGVRRDERMGGGRGPFIHPLKPLPTRLTKPIHTRKSPPLLDRL